MYAEQVKAAIIQVQNDPDFCIDSPRVQNAKSLAGELLQKVEESPERFCVFAKSLLGVMQTAYTKDRRMNHSTMRERMWTTFHKMRSHELPSLWCGFMKDIGLENGDTG